MKSIHVLIVACLMVAAAGPAAGQSYYYTAPNTVRFMGGLSFTDGGDFAKDAAYFNDLNEPGLDLGDPAHALNVALAWERNLNAAVALGVEGQFDRIASRDEVVNAGIRDEVTLSGTSWAVLGNLVLTPTPSRNLYFGAGAGMAFARVSEDIREDGEDMLGGKASDWAPTFQGFVGLTMPMGPRASVGIQGTYRFREIKMSEATVTVQGQDFQTFDFGDDKFKFDLSGPAVSLVFSHQL